MIKIISHMRGIKTTLFTVKKAIFDKLTTVSRKQTNKFQSSKNEKEKNSTHITYM